VPSSELEALTEQARQTHQDGLDSLLEPFGLSSSDPEVYLLKGNPAATIHSLSGDLKADLVVMGTVGRTGIPGFFIGNTAEEVLQAATASVLAVKPKDFVSPVASP
jgi:nucleotide-binding universal stress UspA family protein